MEYNTNVHTVSLGLDLAATEKLNLFGNALYSSAKAEMKGLSLAFPEEVVDPVVLNNYPIGKMAGIERYSDLEYSQVEINVGGTYQFSPLLYTTASVTYDKFMDDETYVYGDQDGTAWRGYLGVGYRF